METLEYAADQAKKLLGQLAFQVSRTTRRHDPDEVHDLRVAIRRLAQALVVFERCFPGKEAAKIRRRLKEMLALAGEVRNCDIALKFLSRSDLAEGDALYTRLETGRREAERTLVGLLRRWTGRNSSAKWRRSLETGSASKPFCRNATEDTAQQVLSRMAEKFFKTGDEAVAAKASPKDLHRFRIHSKKLRYSLELFAPLYGPALNNCLEPIRKVQTLLGAINDCQTTRELLSRYGGDKGLDAKLKKRQRRKTDEFSRYWADTFAGPQRERLERYVTSGVGRKRTIKAQEARAERAALSASSGAAA
jgi:CHAD domain-containing protein